MRPAGVCARPGSAHTFASPPSAFTPFGGEFDQLFNRMVRAWSFGFLEPAPNGQLRALHSAEHTPKVEVQENGKTYEFHRYDGAGHGIFYYQTPLYRPQQAMDCWSKIFTFFENKLGG